MPSPKGTAATLRASVGRNALIPPHPAAAQTPAGGINPAPTTDGRPAANPEKPRSRCTANLCRGRCLHCARRRVSEANRAAGPALRPEIVPGTLRWRKVSREGHGPPLQTTENDRPNRDGRDHPGDRRAGCPHPAALRGGTNARGRDKSRPYDQRKARGQPGNGNLAAPQTSVGDDARIVPHPRGGANAPGRDKSRPYDRRKARTQPGNLTPATNGRGRPHGFSFSSSR